MLPQISSCTTILVGKYATYDGSTMMARTDDSGAGRFDPRKRIIVQPSEQPRHYKSVLSKFEIDLPDNPLRYSSMPKYSAKERGIWGEAGINSKNVAVSETETISSNARVLGADPLVENGFGEEDILTIVLPYINTAREGVERLGNILEKYGTYEMNGIGFQDENEIWWFETIGGHHFIAKRVPDNEYAVIPNQQGIKTFDFVDAFGEKKHHICSKDLIDFIINNKLNVSINQENLKNEKNFEIRPTLGSHTDFDRTYNTPRAWCMHKYLSPKKFKWEGPNADFTPESDDLPWSLKPEHKITVEDIKYLMSSYYQGTKYNPYGKNGDLSEKGKYRPIGINRTSFLTLTQIRGYLPDEIRSVEWIPPGCCAFNAFIPQYSNTEDSPKYLKDVNGDVNTENFYWNNRLIAALADQHYNEAMVWIDRYQNKMAAKGHEFINKFDKEFKEGKNEKGFLEKGNEEIAEFVKRETTDVLGKVLYTASLQMKNAFSRSDA